MSTINTIWHDTIAEIQLHRPEQSNALTFAMMAELIDAVECLMPEPKLTAVILSGGQARHFCAGLDFTEFTNGNGLAAFADHADKTLDNYGANLFQRTSTVWRDLPVPVIAALHGAVIGGGLQIALGADIRLATPDSKLSIREAVWGLVPDMGITHSLPALLSMDKAAELILTARNIDATEAAALGLVTRLCDDSYAEALQLAKTISQMSPESIRANKRLYRSAWQASDSDLLALEASLQKSLIGTPNQIESVMARLQKREPNFKRADN